MLMASTLVRLALISGLAQVQLLILNDLFLSPLSDPERKDLLEIIEDRHALASTVITSQCPTKDWHHIIGSPLSPTPSATAYSTTVTRLNSKESRSEKARNKTTDLQLSKPLSYEKNSSVASLRWPPAGMLRLGGPQCNETGGRIERNTQAAW